MSFKLVFEYGICYGSSRKFNGWAGGFSDGGATKKAMLQPKIYPQKVVIPAAEIYLLVPSKAGTDLFSINPTVFESDVMSEVSSYSC